MTFGEFKKLMADHNVPDTAELVYWDRYYDQGIELTEKMIEPDEKAVYIG